MSVLRSCNRAAICRGRGFLDNLGEIASNIDFGSLVNTGKKVLSPLLQEISFFQPPPRPGRGRGGVYKNQGGRRIKKIRGKGVTAVTSETKFANAAEKKRVMDDFKRMTLALQMRNQTKADDSDDDDDD